jgi:hypothetical protein
MIKNCLSAESLLALALTMSVSTQAFAGDTNFGSDGMVGREIAAPSWSAACASDQGPRQCDEPMWVYGSRAYVSRFRNAF